MCLAVDVPDSDLLLLNEALQKLERKDRLKENLVKLRFFAGLSNQQAADALGFLSSTPDKYWAYGRCWLRVEIAGGDEIGR